MSKNRGASSVTQLTNNEDGILSAPTAERVESSCIASIIIYSDNTILDKYNTLSSSIDDCVLKKRKWVSNKSISIWLSKNTIKLV